MRPIGKYIVIQKIKEEVKTESGLLLSGSDVDDIRYKKGIVVETGTDVTSIDSNDTIYYDSRAGYSLMMSGEQYTVIQERDVVIVE
jgi:co-chaperonin GroES (HSP10)